MKRALWTRTSIMVHPNTLELLCRLLVLAVVILPSPVADATQLMPQTVVDSYGNSADNASTIAWASLPSFSAYQPNTTYDAGSLAQLYSIATTFVNQCIPGTTPWALLMGILNGTTAFDKSIIMKLLQWAYGFVTAIAIGILFIVFVPIVGCCFCCCRTCCKKCGGKMVQNRKRSYKCFRAFYAIGLTLCCVFLGAGMVCTYYTNEAMTTSVSKIGNVITSNLNDLETFLNNTVNQITYTANQGFNFTSAVIFRDLDNVGPLVGDPVHQKFAAMGVSSAFAALLTMDPLLSTLVTSLTNVQTAITTTQTKFTALSIALSGLSTNVTNTKALCTSVAQTCYNFPWSGLTTNFNPGNMPSFSSQLTQLQTVQSKNITALVINGQTQFDNISAIVAEKALPTMTALKSQLSSFSGTISSSLSQVTSMVSSFSSITGYGVTLTSYLTQAANYEQYRWYAGVGLTCIILLVLFLQVCGLILGCCGCLTDKDALPTKRGACGNCGGGCLMASVGFAFIFGWLLMLLVLITFLIGAPLNKLLCQSVRDPDLTFLKELVDGGPNATSLLGTPGGYPLGAMILSNSSVPLTASGLLKSCKSGTTAWNALYLSSLIDIDSITNYKSQINVNQSIAGMNVDLSSLTILDANTQTQMTTMATSILAINFTGLIAELSKSTVNSPLANLSISLRALAADITTPSTAKTEFTSEAASADSIDSVQVAAVNSAQVAMLASIQALQVASASVPSQINSLLTLLNNTQIQININGASDVKDASWAFANRIISSADQFVTFALNAIQNQVGVCTPIWNLYDSIFNVAICGYLIDILDAFWFSLGWCVAFFVPSMIFATKFAKHVRRMDSLDVNDKQAAEESSLVARSSRVSIRHHKIAPA